MKLRALLIAPCVGLAWLSRAPAASRPAEAPERSADLAAAQRFRFDAGAPLLAPAGVAEDGTLCVGTVDGYVHSLNPDGSYRWSHTLRGAVTRRPLHAGQRWYLATSADRVYALSADGSLYWVFKPPSPVSSELAADAAGTAYFVAADHFLYALSGHGAITLRVPFGELKAGPCAGLQGEVWLENSAGTVLRVQAGAVRRFAPGGAREFEFPEPNALRDAEGHLWRGRGDGTLEFSVAPGGSPRLLPVTGSPLLTPTWSPRAHYAVISSRSGLLLALDPSSLR